MTKIILNSKDVMTAEQLFYGLIYNSPYTTVAIKYLQLKGVALDFNGYYNISDLLEAYHELAKVDHKTKKPDIEDINDE